MAESRERQKVDCCRGNWKERKTVGDEKERGGEGERDLFLSSLIPKELFEQ